MSVVKERGPCRIGWRARVVVGLVLVVALIWIPQQVFVDVGGFALVYWRTLLTCLVLIGGVVVAGSAYVARRHKTQEQAPSYAGKKPLLREIPAWSIWAGIAGLGLVGIAATWYLVSTFGRGTAQDQIKLEAIKLAGSIVVGTGGAAALVLTARRQMVSELDLLQRDRVADDNRHDANERRATELYTAAADQLASDKAPIRMAGMYALARLGELNAKHRQTVVNLLCAYLRMPDTSIDGDWSPQPEPEIGSKADKSPNRSQTVYLDLAPALATAAGLSLDASEQQRQEREVRLTAQRLLFQHLQPFVDKDGTPTNSDYWAGMDLDLTGASLHSWDFSGCEVQNAWFDRAHFSHTARFDGAHFCRGAWFEGATFSGDARFESATFSKEVLFNDANFSSETWFGYAKFNSDALFNGAKFSSFTTFSRADFSSSAEFDEVKFSDAAWFGGVSFSDAAWFGDASFALNAWFGGASFGSRTSFYRASFSSAAQFAGASFRGDVEFTNASFRGDAEFGGASFRSKASFEGAQQWKEGRWGMLVWNGAKLGPDPIDTATDE